MSPPVQKDILWLQISVNYVILMELLNCNQDFGQVEPRVFQGQASLLFDLREKLSTRQVLQQQVQILIVLHRLNELYEETTLSRPGLLSHLSQNILLILNVLDVLCASNSLLLNLLKSKKLP